MAETVNPYASPTAVDCPPPPECDSFYGTISRTFNLSRRYKFFIRPGELLAGVLPGGTRQRVRRRVLTGMVVIVATWGAVLASTMVPAWEDAIAYLFAGSAVALVAVMETMAWVTYRRKTRGLTLYDLVTPSLETFQEIDRHSFRIRASEVITMKAQRGRKVVRDALDLTLEPGAGRPQRIRIELEGMIDKLGIERALYEAGFPTMPTQWGTERE